MTSLEPPADRVIVRVHAPDTETAFGLALPEQAQADSSFATVLAVGAGRFWNAGRLDEYWASNGVNVHDVVVMPKFGGTEIDYPGEGQVVSILASELLAVVT